MPALLAGPRSTDVKIEELRFEYEDFRYRTPYKFGGMMVDRVTLCNVHCVVANKAAKRAAGFASMPMGNMWSFPAPDLSYDTTLEAMKALAERIAKTTRAIHPEYAHPLDVNVRVGAGVSESGRGRLKADSEALHAGDGEPVRCRAA